MPKSNFVLIRGGGDLATGVALRLHRAGIKVLITEIAQPLAVRLTVAFANTVYRGQHEVEGVKSKLIEADQLSAWNEAHGIPVIIDPELGILSSYSFPVIVDARLTKQTPSPLPHDVPLHIGLGPGFTAGDNCHAVIETRRSHTLGRVIWDGTSQPDSGQPDGDPRRVLRAPADGILLAHENIGEHLKEGQLIAEIRSTSSNENWKVTSPFVGVLRGLIHDDLQVTQGLKIGDVDPRNDETICYLVSDKALSVGGGVLEAIFSKKEFRKALYTAD